MAIIESVLSRLRVAAGRSWVEPERVRLTLNAKVRPLRFKDATPIVDMHVQIEGPGTDITVSVAGGRERIMSRAR